MNKKIKAIIATLLVLIMLAGTIAVSATAQTQPCDCEYTPSLVIPGIFQSKVRYYDDIGNEVKDENGEILSAPFFIETMPLVKLALKKALIPVILSLILQQDIGLSDAVAAVAADAFSINACDDNGQPINNVRADKYPHSLAECTQDEKNHIYRAIPLQKFSEIAGEDHLYFYSYNSLGNLNEQAAEIYAMINQMIEETGHDKVNLVPISMGGALANALLDYYPDVADKINRVIYIIPALDGSNIVGDVYSGRFSTTDDMLYDELIPSLMDYSSTSYLIDILLRILPKKTVHSIFDKTVDSLSKTLLRNCTMLWGLVPSAYYQECSDKWLSDPAQAKIKAQTDRYYQAQLRSDANIMRLVEKGVKVFDVVAYNHMMYKITPSWSKSNADGIIHTDSTSMGATFGYIDTPLDEAYVQQNTHCSAAGHNHISPDRIVDASTGLLPDTTFYFADQDHERTGTNDVVMRLAVALLTDEDFTSVYSYPEDYPQFNHGRDGRDLNNTIAYAKECIANGKVTGSDAAMLQSKIDAAQNHMNKTNVNGDEYARVLSELQNALVELGLRNPPEDTSKEETLVKIFKGINDFLNKNFGARGFSDPHWEI